MTKYYIDLENKDLEEIKKYLKEIEEKSKICWLSGCKPTGYFPTQKFLVLRRNELYTSNKEEGLIKSPNNFIKKCIEIAPKKLLKNKEIVSGKVIVKLKVNKLKNFIEKIKEQSNVNFNGIDSLRFSSYTTEIVLYLNKGIIKHNLRAYLTYEDIGNCHYNKFWSESDFLKECKKLEPKEKETSKIPDLWPKEIEIPTNKESIFKNSYRSIIKKEKTETPNLWSKKIEDMVKKRKSKLYFSKSLSF